MQSTVKGPANKDRSSAMDIYCLEYHKTIMFQFINEPSGLQHLAFLHNPYINLRYRQHTNELFSELRILKLIDIVKLRSACIMYKAHKKLLPNNLQLLISLDSTRGHITRQGNSNTFKQVFARTTLKSQCISVQGIKLWNSLENSIKCAKNIFMFRKLYK